jgi:hypothetical protein
MVHSSSKEVAQAIGLVSRGRFPMMHLFYLVRQVIGHQRLILARFQLAQLSAGTLLRFAAVGADLIVSLQHGGSGGSHSAGVTPHQRVRKAANLCDARAGVLRLTSATATAVYLITLLDTRVTGHCSFGACTRGSALGTRANAIHGERGIQCNPIPDG